MPEGHTIHRLAREHRALLVGEEVSSSSPQGRFAAEARRVDGRTLLEVRPYGKHLFYAFEGDRVVHVHLGLQGKMFPLPPEAPPPRGQIRWRLLGPRGGFDLVAPIVCELVTPDEEREVLARLGPDPLLLDVDPRAVVAAVRASRKPVGAILLDQGVLAGVGNVFRTEALFLAGVHPTTPGSALDARRARRLYDVLVRLMQRALEEGRIASVDTPKGVDRASLPEKELRFVYKQKRCRRCGAPVEVEEVGGRTSYACPREQPREPEALREARS